MKVNLPRLNHHKYFITFIVTSLGFIATSEISAEACQELSEGEDHVKAHTKRRRDVCTFLDLDRKTDKFTVR